MTRAAHPGLTDDFLGNMFICGSGHAEVIPCYERNSPRAVAGNLLEEVGAWKRALDDLPPDYQIPPGVVAAVDAAYHASIAWVELLDRAAKR